MAKKEPLTNQTSGLESRSTYAERMLVRMMDSAVLKHRMMLSAYFNTAAQSRPPKALVRMTLTTFAEYPWVKPPSTICSQSLPTARQTAMNEPKAPSCTFLTQMEASVCFSNFSR